MTAARARIALTPTQGLARGMTVRDTGGPLKAPVGKAVLSRMFDVFGRCIDRGPALADVEWRSVHRPPPALSRRSTKSEVFETGIKVMRPVNGSVVKKVRAVMAKLEAGFLHRLATYRHE